MRVVVMGVTGSGKSTLAAGVAREFGLEFADADHLHPDANIAKMSAGIPLTDDDRWPWLDAVGARLASSETVVIACSALKRAYRDRIREAAPGTLFVHAVAPRTVLEERVSARLADGHFAGPELLESQFAALEHLAFDEPGGVVDVANLTPEQALAVATEMLAALDS